MEFSLIAVILLLILLLAEAQGNAKSEVTLNPDKHVFIGEDVTLRCGITGAGEVQWTYSWYKNNNEFKENKEQKYRIQSVASSDSGNYTCRGHDSNSQRAEISDALTMIVSDKPKPTVRVNPQISIYTGDRVTLLCDLQQKTGWEFHWYKNNENSQNHYSEQANTFKVTVDNAGETVYQCIARRKNNFNNEVKYYYTELSDPVNITVTDSLYRTETVGLAVGLSLGFLVIVLLILILLWYYKKKEKQQKSNDTSEQNQKQTGAKDSQLGNTTSGLIPGCIYRCADAELDINDVAYADLQLKPMKKVKSAQEKSSVCDDTVYSELYPNKKNDQPGE